MPHDHASHSEHYNPQALAENGRALLIGIALNLGLVAAEATYGLLGHSMALLSDAGHNLGDALGLVAAYVATVLSARRPTRRLTYGWGSSSILAALFNSVLLMMAVGAISLGAIERFVYPEPVASQTMMAVAALAVVINSLAAMLFAHGSARDINIRAAFIHMAGDAAVSGGVLIAGFAIQQTGWLWLDPLVSLAINGVIVWATWELLTTAVGMSMAAVPRSIDPDAVSDHLRGLPGVAELHDLHIWSLSTTEIAMTCHLVMQQGHPGDRFLRGLQDSLTDLFQITHCTVQIEIDPHDAHDAIKHGNH